jgi:ABC-type transport system involved in multi-copper enzyme maturation permease subunit
MLIILIALANRYDVLSIGRSKILLVDLGLALLSLVGAGSVLILGFEVPRELRQRVAENLLSKPVGRDQYLIGKFLGTILFAIGNVLFVGIGFIIVCAISGAFPGEMLLPLLGVIGMVLMLAACAAFFGTFLGEVPAVVATFLVFWLGHSTQLLAKMADKGSAHAVLRFFYGLMPNLGLVNTRADASQSAFVHTSSLSWAYTVESLGYAILYTFVVFLAAMFVFRQRDL